MSPEEVKDVISGTFGCTAFTVLQSAKGGYLLRSDEELTAKIAIARRGALYLCEVTEEKKPGDGTSTSMSLASTSANATAHRTTSGLKRTKDSSSESDYEVPFISVFSNTAKRVKRKSTRRMSDCGSDSDLETPRRKTDECHKKKTKQSSAKAMMETSDGHIGSAESPVMVPSSGDEREDTGHIPRAGGTSKESLEEYRRIRREQDEEYARSLCADQLKEKQREDTKKLEGVRVQLRSQVEELMNRSDSVFCVSVILPNSTRIECRLPESPSAKVLYEAIFALSSVDSPFSVYTRVGHVLVDPDCASLSELVQVSSVFVVEENDSGPDLLSLFSTPVDKSSPSGISGVSKQCQQDELHDNLCIGMGETDVNSDSQDYSALREQEYANRKDFMMRLSCKHGCSHLIRRDHIYSDVLELYGDFNAILNEFPFRVSFDDEHAVDSGGVARDMFSGFWSCAFEKFFDGSGSLVPSTHPTIDMSVFPMLGNILSHGYIACGFLPVHISFPVIAAVLIGPDVQISDTILCKSFISYLSCHDACILKNAFGEIGSKTFSSNLQSSLMTLLGTYGCRQIPSPDNIKSLVTMVAKRTFLVKPLASLYAMFGGIAAAHKDFWKDVTVEHLMEVYLSSNATAYNVLKVMKEPLLLQPLQETTYGYLLQYVGNMRNAEVRNFLRFVTGSSALVVDEIKVTFNGLTGLTRRPIAHTCSSTLELPVSYATYLEFAQEFDSILTSELSWIMDAL